MANPFLFRLAQQGDGAPVNRGTGGIVGNNVEQNNAAPDLIGNPTAFTGDRSQIQLIDVVHDFPWTQTPGTGRHEVPFIRLSEYRVKFNSLVQNIKYQLQAFETTLGGVGRNLESKAATMGLVGKGATKIASTGTAAITATSKFVREAATGKAIIGEDVLQTHVPSYLHPYANLYGVVPTGFEYYFPYFQPDWKNIDAQWGETKGGGMFKFITDLANKDGVISTYMDTAMADQNVLGTYIEAPKMYSYGDGAPTVEINLVLSNTDNEDDIIRNWHLVFMLAYQNLPNKTNKVMLEPPAIYEVEIPGSTYFPYAFIKSVKIVNRGATRVLTLPYYNLTDDKGIGSIPAEKDFFRTPERWDSFSSHKAARNTLQKGLWHKIVSTDKLEKDKQNQLKLIEAVIPDAYEIRIVVESLLPETKNLLFHSTLGSGTLANGLYSVSMSGQQ